MGVKAGVLVAYTNAKTYKSVVLILSGVREQKTSKLKLL